MYFVGEDKIKYNHFVFWLLKLESSETPPELWGMRCGSVDYPCLTACLPKCFLIPQSSAWPQLFPNRKRIPVQTKQNILDEQMCFKNGPRYQVDCREGYSPRMSTVQDSNTRGAHKHMHEQTCTNTDTETYKHIWIFYVRIIKDPWTQTWKMQFSWTQIKIKKQKDMKIAEYISPSIYITSGFQSVRSHAEYTWRLKKMF